MTQNLSEKIDKLIKLMGFSDFYIENDEEGRRISITINDDAIAGDNLPGFVLNMNRLARLMEKNVDARPIIIDINNYRKDREGLILKLARAAATKASVTKESVSLPAMNAYERRLVHTELSTRPDIETESSGENKNRYVVIAPIE